MEPLRDDQLIADLQALRPTPRPQFAAELDERAAAGFPRRPATGPWEELRTWLASLNPRPVPGQWEDLRPRLPSLTPRQILIPAAGAAAVVIAVATAALVIGQGGGG